MNRHLKPISLLVCLLLASLGLQAQEIKATHTIYASAEVFLTAGSGEFTPYYIMANRHGILTSSKDLLLRGTIAHREDTAKRFSYSYGADFLAGYASNVDYLHYNTTQGELLPHSTHPPRIWLQQLYGQVRYRGVFLMAGMKEYGSALLNQHLSSGDLVESGNARPIPQVRIGFNDFQNIPFTRGWVQIQGEIGYGKMMDNDWVKDHYNYLSSHINVGALYSYKRCYFRTKPSQPLSVTVGMQVGCFFGGTSRWYYKGEMVREQHFSRGIKQFFKMFFPTDGGLEYYSGSSLGSWDLMFRYRFRDNSTLKAYLQKPWEDGSGIGFLNGFDGLWGFEYSPANLPWLKGLVVEYLDFTNQSGPMHWDPDDHPGTTLHHRAEGADDYYNNGEYNSYANYGMALGTPFTVSPIYNLNGYPQFAYNRLRGFHIGANGQITSQLSYRILGGYRRSWGKAKLPLLSPRSDTSFLAQATYSPRQLPHISATATFALDHGTLLGNNTAGMITLRYSGEIKIKR